MKKMSQTLPNFTGVLALKTDKSNKGQWVIPATSHFKRKMEKDKENGHKYSAILMVGICVRPIKRQ